ncbi:MAG: WYL domain-containing protein [Chloroflexi bacterium]|jgi:DNA polymerase III subunit epsilon|nr:WYL domain-containing protein [Chloroflexota bacterium]
MNSSERNQLLQLPLSDVPFVLFDVESTGLEPQNGDRVCEIALVHWQGGVQRGSYQTLINPGRPISPDAFAVNKIPANLLAQSPSFAAVSETILEHLAGKVLVAHNAPFDFSFLNVELLRLEKAPLNNPLVDTLQLARTFLNHERYNLAALSRALGVESPSHRAMSDVVALKALFVHLLERLRMLGVSTLDDLLRAQRGLLPGSPEPSAPPALLTALREGRKLHITYRTGGGDPVPREILPLELQMIGGTHRLIAFCYLRNAQRTFYLDRIGTLDLVEE